MQAGVQVSRLEDKDIIFSIGSALEDFILLYFVIVRNIDSDMEQASLKINVPSLGLGQLLLSTNIGRLGCKGLGFFWLRLFHCLVSGLRPDSRMVFGCVGPVLVTTSTLGNDDEELKEDIALA
ncbi:hypothetical protein Tco_0905300 [Tanacetum coccineum]